MVENWSGRRGVLICAERLLSDLRGLFLRSSSVFASSCATHPPQKVFDTLLIGLEHGGPSDTSVNRDGTVSELIFWCVSQAPPLAAQSCNTAVGALQTSVGRELESRCCAHRGSCDVIERMIRLGQFGS